MNTALGWALVHFVWQAALIVLLLAAVLPACRRSTLRYGLACTALFLMLAAFAGTFLLAVPDRHGIARPANVLSLAAPGSGAPIGEPAPSALQRALPWLAPFWIAGALMVGLYRLGGWLAARRLRKTGVFAAPAVWQRRLDELARRIGVSAPVALLESALAEVPVVIGVMRPAILIPAGLVVGLPAAQLEAILLHELAHVRRMDYLVNLLQTAVECLLFYHPAVWWVSNFMRAERENCCDDVAVAAQGDPGGYAAALLSLEERRVVREPALAATGGNLMNRIRRLLLPPRRQPAAAGLMLSMLLLLALLALMAAAQQPPSGPYQKWVDEDVVYIIRPEERAAFQRLATDEERNRFIEQFWRRRDPTPATAENEFKSEHYRRIGYSNERFPSSTAPGWKTDRGRLYIVLGPPDEIESHPSDGREKWLFHYLEGIGRNVIVEFTDPDHTGDYRQTRDPRAIQ